ncbi:MAG: glycoside-pentoside-hexuronide (GPH):cation symporter [Treponema sp.]|nr:glycoside-pentoside-hexuronide (GPH):cation symporter [Treponema sp.]
MEGNEISQVIPKVKLKEKMGFLAFSGSINIVYLFRSSYYLFFLTEVLKLSMATAGAIVALSMVWDAVNDPLIGYWALNRKFKNGEKLRPFALWHSVPWAIILVLVFTDFGVSQTLTIVLAYIFYMTFQVFNTTVVLPYNAMAGLATNNDIDRRSINVFRNIGACLGSGIGAVACLPLLMLFGALNSEGNLNPEGASMGFFLVSCIMGSIVIAGSIMHYVTTKERVKQVSTEETKLSFQKVVRMLIKCRSWRFNTVYVICYGLINMLLMQSLAYHATYVLGRTAAVTMIQAAYLIATLLASFIVSPVDKMLGRRRAMILGPVIALLGKVWFVINPFSLGAIYMNAVSVGISVAFCFVLFNTNRNSIVDIIESKEGRRIDSMIATADGLAAKLSTAAVTALTAFMLEFAGYDPNLTVQPDSAIRIINMILGWMPGFVGLIMVVFAYFHPIEKEYEEARKKLQGS